MLVRVRSRLGTWRIGDINERSTIDDVKSEIYKCYNIPLTSQMLSADRQATKLLESNQTLSQLSIQHGDMIYLSVQEETERTSSTEAGAVQQSSDRLVFAAPSPLTNAGESIASCSGSSSYSSLPNSSEGDSKNEVEDHMQSDAMFARALAESMGAQGNDEPEVRAAIPTRRERLIDDDNDWDMDDIGLGIGQMGLGSMEDTLNRLQIELAQNGGLRENPQAMLQAIEATRLATENQLRHVQNARADTGELSDDLA